MALVKKKHKSAPNQDSWLENLLRFEIIFVLFALIGVYYFLSFSPIRMPEVPIASPRVPLALLPAAIETVPAVPETGASAAPAEAAPAVSGAAAGAAASESAPGAGLQAGFGSGVAPLSAAGAPALTVGGQNGDETSPVKASPDLVQSGLGPDKASSASSIEVSASEPVAPAAVAKVTSVIEVASFVLKPDLQKACSQLEALGFTVKKEPVKLLTPMFRVFLGPYAQLPEAEKMMAVVRKKGDHPFMQRREDGYLVVIGSFYLETSVVAWENMYQAAGLEPKVSKERLLIPQAMLLLDGPQIDADPEAVLAQLQSAGFSGAVLKKNIPTRVK
ncbi:MAG: SPOR domain-containing protein [Deltaproteobacteria bacterium]|nr:SPOR domain-containing protein [Deltaproteobacteria bacterium]